MITSEFSHSQEPSSPQQAADLLREVGTLTTMQGKNYSDRNTVSSPVTEMPDEIAKHLPEPRSTSSGFDDSAYIVQIFDRDTGQPKREDVVGMATFTRQERVDKDLIYAAHVNYHITTKDNGQTYGLERHVTNTEHGPHKVRKMHDFLGRTAVDPAGAANDLLQELTSLFDRVEANRPMEQAMGMFDVSHNEAQQVINYVHSLNGEQ